MSRAYDLLLVGACFLVLALSPPYVQAAALVLAGIALFEHIVRRQP